MNRNRFISAAAGAALIFQMAMPTVAAAQNGNASNQPEVRGREAAAGQVRSQVCERLDQFADRAMQRVSSGKGRLSENRAAREGRLSERHLNRLERLEQVRTARTERHDERFELLLGSVSDDTKKQALLEFQAEVQAAVDARRAAYDAAIEDFWTAADGIVDERQAAIDAAAADFEAAVDAAIAAAKAACEGDGDLATVRDDLNAALRSAHDAFSAAMQDIRSYGDYVRDLVDIRKAAFEAARADFQTALDSAKTTLAEKLSALESDDGEDAEDEGDDDEEDEDDDTDTGTTP